MVGFLRSLGCNEDVHRHHIDERMGTNILNKKTVLHVYYYMYICCGARRGRVLAALGYVDVVQQIKYCRTAFFCRSIMKQGYAYGTNKSYQRV